MLKAFFLPAFLKEELFFYRLMYFWSCVPHELALKDSNIFLSCEKDFKCEMSSIHLQDRSERCSVSTHKRLNYNVLEKEKHQRCVDEGVFGKMTRKAPLCCKHRPSSSSSSSIMSSPLEIHSKLREPFNTSGLIIGDGSSLLQCYKECSRCSARQIVSLLSRCHI